MNQWNFKHFFYIILLYYKTNKNVYESGFFMNYQCFCKQWYDAGDATPKYDCSPLYFINRKSLWFERFWFKLKDQYLVKKSENSKVKILFIVWSQCVLRCINSYKRKYQCSKLNTYLVTTFLSKWGYFVYIEIPLRLSPAPKFQSP